MDQREDIATEEPKPDFIVEKPGDKFLIVTFKIGLNYFENLTEKLSQLIQYTLTKKQQISKEKRIILQLSIRLDDKWSLVCKALSKFAEKLLDIYVLDFQNSDFSKLAVFEFYLLYAGYESMKNLPSICMDNTYAHDDYKYIISELKREKRGMEFLKKLFFRENKKFENKT